MFQPSARNQSRTTARTFLARLLVCGGLALSLPSIPALAQATPTGTGQDYQTLASNLWSEAKSGKSAGLLALAGETDTESGAKAFLDQAALLKANLAKQEEARTKKLAETDEKLKAQIDKDEPSSLSDSLKLAVEMLLATKADQRDAFKHEPRIVSLVERANKAAHECESKGDWFTANEIFYRMHALMEEEGIYKKDVRRLNQRLAMIRLYSPEQFWTLRNNERLKDKKSPLPPYNGLGEDYHERLDKITPQMVLSAIKQAGTQQIDGITLRDAMLGGVEAIRVMLTTTDLNKVFPRLGEQDKVNEVIVVLNEWTERLNKQGMIATTSALQDCAEQLCKLAEAKLGIPQTAVLHEFGNGAMDKMDEFSAIIWPDEVARFDRMTQGNFRGVGVQIQMDEESQMIKIVTPLEGTPAQRAGIRMGDLIKKIDDDSAVGITLNQAVDKITGPENSTVVLTIERKTGKQDDKGKDEMQDLLFPLQRALIPVASVKGWKRTGPKEGEWEWFIDSENKIGYIRLVQFTENTTTDLQMAIQDMQKTHGLNGLILDLRFNPGGLLTEAVGVANTFLDHGVIVSTKGKAQGGIPGETRSATRQGNLVKNIPMAVLINEGSASASEIVSGALRFYADRGDIPAILIGKRSFGKGSVQNVWPLTTTGSAKMKLTTQYYYLPDGRVIHRKPGAANWGVDPHLVVDMLPETESDALKLRQDADVLAIDDKGEVIPDTADSKHPDPSKLLTDGLDVQLQSALVLLQSKAVAQHQAHANLGAAPASDAPQTTR